MNGEISVVASHNIDRNKWNGCIGESQHGLIYALTDYLDHMTEQWTGIVINDYEAVLPVPWKKKFGIKYTYAVPFIQQLGLFSKHESIVDDEVMKAIFSVCRYGEYYFNYASHVSGAIARVNYVLPLKPFNELIKSFSDDAQQLVRKTLLSDLEYTSASLDEAIDLCRELYGNRFPNVKESDYENFKRVCRFFSSKDAVVLKKVSDKKNNTLAVVLLLQYRDRLYNLINGTTPEGRAVKANYFLLSNVWKEFESSNLLFDFEGSELPGVKEFYEKFSPQNQPYFNYRFNHLRFPANIFKK